MKNSKYINIFTLFFLVSLLFNFQIVATAIGDVNSDSFPCPDPIDTDKPSYPYPNPDFNPTMLFVIKNAQSGKVLNNPSASTRNESPITQYDWVGATTEQWYIISNGNGTVRIKNAQSGKVLNNPSASTRNGTQITQYDWVGAITEQWYIINNGNGTVRIKNAQSGKVLNNPNASTQNESPITQHDWVGAPTEQWYIVH